MKDLFTYRLLSLIKANADLMRFRMKNTNKKNATNITTYIMAPIRFAVFFSSFSSLA